MLQVRVTHGTGLLPLKMRGALHTFTSKMLVTLGVTLGTLAFEDDIARAPLRARRFKACIGAWPNTRASQKAARRSFIAFWQQTEPIVADACQCCQATEEDTTDEKCDELLVA